MMTDCSCSRGGNPMFCEHNEETYSPLTCPHCGSARVPSNDDGDGDLVCVRRCDAFYLVQVGGNSQRVRGRNHADARNAADKLEGRAVCLELITRSETTGSRVRWTRKGAGYRWQMAVLPD